MSVGCVTTARRQLRVQRADCRVAQPASGCHNSNTATSYASLLTNNVHHTGLLRYVLAAPGEVSALQTQSPELWVATAAAHQVDTLGAQLGHCRWAADLELPLLLVGVTTAASCTPLVAGITSDCCISEVTMANQSN